MLKALIPNPPNTPRQKDKSSSGPLQEEKDKKDKKDKKDDKDKKDKKDKKEEAPGKVALRLFRVFLWGSSEGVLRVLGKCMDVWSSGSGGCKQCFGFGLFRPYNPFWVQGTKLSLKALRDVFVVSELAIEGFSLCLVAVPGFSLSWTVCSET